MLLNDNNLKDIHSEMMSVFEREIPDIDIKLNISFLKVYFMILTIGRLHRIILMIS